MTYRQLAKDLLIEATKAIISGSQPDNITPEDIEDAVEEALVSADMDAFLNLPDFDPEAEVPEEKVERLKAIGKRKIIESLEKELNEDLHTGVDETSTFDHKRIRRW